LNPYRCRKGTNADYIDLILRLKQLVIYSSSVDEITVTLEHKGKGLITAAMIQENPNIKIINKDLYLLEVTEDVDFNRHRPRIHPRRPPES